MRKQQLTVYLEPATLRMLEVHAAKRGAAKSLVAEAAILSFLSGDDADRREAAIAKRLDRHGRILERLERNDAVALEAFALFVSFWLTQTPALPEHGTVAARTKGKERYGQFVVALGRRLARGASLLQDVALDTTAAFSSQDDD